MAAAGRWVRLGRHATVQYLSSAKRFSIRRRFAAECVLAQAPGPTPGRGRSYRGPRSVDRRCQMTKVSSILHPEEPRRPKGRDTAGNAQKPPKDGYGVARASSHDPQNATSDSPAAVADGRSTEIARTRETEKSVPVRRNGEGIQERRLRLCCGFVPSLL